MSPKDVVRNYKSNASSEQNLLSRQWSHTSHLQEQKHGNDIAQRFGENKIGVDDLREASSCSVLLQQGSRNDSASSCGRLTTY